MRVRALRSIGAALFASSFLLVQALPAATPPGEKPALGTHRVTQEQVDRSRGVQIP